MFANSFVRHRDMKNYIRKSGIVCVCMGILCTGLFAKEIRLGGKNGWPQLEVADNVTTGIGRFGYQSVELKTNDFEADGFTDLILNFENPSNPVSFGDYTVLKNDLQNVSATELGKGAGLSRDNGGITLKGKEGTFFGSEGLSGSFSIDFWLNPALAENGEEIFQWHSSRTVDNHIIYQMMNANFEGGHIKWYLSNIFDNFYEGNQKGCSIGTRKNLFSHNSFAFFHRFAVSRRPFGRDCVPRKSRSDLH